MNEDKYKIIMSLSHHRISFEYWLRDGEDKLQLMPGGNWPSPLAFYCSQSGIVIGEEAARAAQTGTPNAFDNYFDRLSEGETYQFGNQCKPIGNLLLDAAETVFREFYRSILFNRYGSLTENRANMPLSIVCEADIESNERAYITSLFKDSGYVRVRVIDYDTYIARFINESLSKDYNCEKVLVAWTEGIDLRLTLFNLNADSVNNHIVLRGLGIDPRLEYVKNLIWNDIIGQNPWLSRDLEDSILTKVAADFINSTAPMVSEWLTLSSGGKYKYSLNRTSVDFIQTDESQSLKAGLDSFLRNADIVDRSNILLLLRGVAAGNAYFEQNLGHGFLKIVRSNDILRNKTMSLLIAEDVPPLEVKIHDADIRTPATESLDLEKSAPKSVILDSSMPDLSKEVRRKWRQIKAEASGKASNGKKDEAKSILQTFYAEIKSTLGVEDILNDINAQIENLTPHINIEAKQLDRKWREIKAKSKAKVRTQNYKEARAILTEFRDLCSNVYGAQELTAKINEELDAIPIEKPSLGERENDSVEYPKSHCISRSKENVTSRNPLVSERASSSSDKQSYKQTEKTQKQQKQEETDKGRELIAQNKLKEARDRYRTNGNSLKARLLSEIIRSQKGVELRKLSLEEYKKNKNTEQIKRIIKELEEYLDLCTRLGIHAEEYRTLLLEYRKIK